MARIKKHNGIAAYSFSQFASAEGKKGGECYTLRCGVKLLVEMLEPYCSRVYDPCCGSSGMFVQSVQFIRPHLKGNGDGGRSGAKAKAEISIYGQDYATWRLAHECRKHGALTARAVGVL